ncbi:hypothetical protein CYMTET_27821, partial [Cymbomonas tetramitiformis]
VVGDALQAPSQETRDQAPATQLLAPSFFLQAQQSPPSFAPSTSSSLPAQASAPARAAIPPMPFAAISGSAAAPMDMSVLMACTTSAALEAEMMQSRSLGVGEAAGKARPIARDDVRQAMLQLLQEDAFIDMLTNALNRQTAR